MRRKRPRSRPLSPKTGWRLTDISSTHHHGDHTAGIAEFEEHHRCRVVAPRNEAKRIAHVDENGR